MDGSTSSKLGHLDLQCSRTDWTQANVNSRGYYCKIQKVIVGPYSLKFHIFEMN